MRKLQPATVFFALGILGFGVLGLAAGSLADEWQPLVPWVAVRSVLGYALAVPMLACGAGLLAERTAAWSVRILLPCLAVWQILRLAVVVKQPGTEVNWESAAEVAVMLTAGLVLFARVAHAGRLSGERGLRLARLWFGAWLIPIGLSHFFYAAITYSLVPTWMPWRAIWGPVTGAAHIAAGLGALAGVMARMAAGCWAAMIALFTVLIWIPRAIAHPHVAGNWGELIASWTMASAAWVIAAGLPGRQRSKG